MSFLWNVSIVPNSARGARSREAQRVFQIENPPNGSGDSFLFYIDGEILLIQFIKQLDGDIIKISVKWSVLVFGINLHQHTADKTFYDFGGRVAYIDNTTD